MRDSLLLAAIIVLWTYMGMYGYIYWTQKTNDYLHRKWRRDEIKLIPIMGILGIFSYIVGHIIFNNNKYKN
jgi:hypothetical protein